MFSLDPLPYDYHHLEPLISAETLRYHYDKHHNGYVQKLNVLAKNNPQVVAKCNTLEDLILCADEHKNVKMFQCAAQTWNHTFYWNSLCKPHSQQLDPSRHEQLYSAIKQSFPHGGLSELKKQFEIESVNHFGSGWTWLCYAYDNNDLGKLKIISTHDADNPLKNFTTSKLVPILTCDLWEHAYYVDYRHERPKYIQSFFEMINFDFAESQITSTPSWIAKAKIKSNL